MSPFPPPPIQTRRPSISAPSRRRSSSSAPHPGHLASTAWAFSDSVVTIVPGMRIFSLPGLILSVGIGLANGTSSVERQGGRRKRSDRDGGRQRVLPRDEPQARVLSPQQHHVNLPVERAGPLPEPVH